eukprot:TRINITY_DN1714_c0_g1_i2.p1 TRINITY_DN1714_c0_g1~~TRINITY_DN1714_c0_g1_i2.p1  ORF type:complete len:100 (-),score=4.70 TRINITY_DN1714_c0_g1_i2:156-455(-)
MPGCYPRKMSIQKTRFTPSRHLFSGDQYCTFFRCEIPVCDRNLVAECNRGGKKKRWSVRFKKNLSYFMCLSGNQSGTQRKRETLSDCRKQKKLRSKVTK